MKWLSKLRSYFAGSRPTTTGAGPHPKNAPGPFYVQDGCCISCDAPFQEAPDLMATEDGRYDYHCHFRKQPTTPDEIERAVRACCVSCTQAVRYAGDDPAILARFSVLKGPSIFGAAIHGWPQTSPHEAIHAFGIKGTTLSEVVAHLGSGMAGDDIGKAVAITLLTIRYYGGRLPLIAIGEGGLLVSMMSVVDEHSDE